MNEIKSKQGIHENGLIASNTEMLGMLEELLGEGKVVRLTIKGRSMQPLLCDGVDQVEIVSPSKEDIVPGMIVLFRYGNVFLLHRIMSRKGDELVLRGDNLFQSKEDAVIEQVIGIVKRIIFPEGKELSTSSLRWKFRSYCWLTIKPVIRIGLNLLSAGKRLTTTLKKK